MIEVIEQRQNWAGNITYGATAVHTPETLAQVQALVASGHRVKALGARHSFSPIADTPGELISLDRLDRVLEIDERRRTVTVEAGIRYGTLGQHLHAAGFALHNLASLPHISVAGACATGTHGSGDRNGNLATAVTELELVTATGDVQRLTRERDGEQFRGAIVGLGGLGVVTKLTLTIEPTFPVRQDLYLDLPLAQLTEHFDAIMGGAYSVSLFTDWRSERINQVWLKRRIDADSGFVPESEWFGARIATRKLHPLGSHAAERCTEQMGVPGPWYELLPHFRMEHKPSSGAELQSEYLVPRQHAISALRALDRLRDQIASSLQIAEVRTVAADDLWMSPSYAQPSVALHFTWLPDLPAIRELLPRIEEQLVPLGARPHWGKLFTVSPTDLAALYPRLPDFRALLQTYDPVGKFRNAFIEEYIIGAE
jgi:xylitol oxidase